MEPAATEYLLLVKEVFPGSGESCTFNSVESLQQLWGCMNLYENLWRYSCLGETQKYWCTVTFLCTCRHLFQKSTSVRRFLCSLFFWCRDFYQYLVHSQGACLLCLWIQRSSGYRHWVPVFSHTKAKVYLQNKTLYFLNVQSIFTRTHKERRSEASYSY